MSLQLTAERYAVQPDEFTAIHRTYKDIITQPWFSTVEDDRKQFARVIIKAFREGMRDAYALQSYCMAIAKERYSSIQH